MLSLEKIRPKLHGGVLVGKIDNKNKSHHVQGLLGARNVVPP